MRPVTEADMKWLKVAAKLSGEEIDGTFEQKVDEMFGPYQELLMLEDYNAKFGSRFGPVGIVAALNNGYLYQPHVEWFPWATAKNKIRTVVMFFQKFRYRDLGLIRVHTIKDYEHFFRRIKKYVPLQFAARIPAGDQFGRGDDYIFYMKCRGGQ